MPDHPPVAHLIRDWRRRAAVTQEGLAELLNVTFSTVSRWENGHVKPSKLAWTALQRVAAERGCPLVPPNPYNPSS
jgi:DNA-binding transcriptional regulator YiaG